MAPITKLTATEILRSMKIIHLAIVFSSASFLVISYVLISTQGPLGQYDKPTSQILITIGMLTAAILVALAYFVHSKRTKQNTNGDFITRLNNYRSSMIVKIAFQESALIFLVVIYMLTSIFSMLLGSIILLILLLLNRPGIELTASELSLNDAEISELRGSH